jgi:N-acetylneuraminic acid mutarotase
MKMEIAFNKLAIVLGFLNLSSEPSFPQSSSLGEWFTRAPLPTPRQEIPHAVLNGKIYVPGGYASGGAATNIVEVFDPVSNTWSSIPALPITMHHLAFAESNGKLYALGGYTTSVFLATARVFEFDPANNIWSEKTTMPGARGAAVAAVDGGKIFVIGGVNQSGVVVGTNQMYDPATDKWMTLVSMPTPREHLAAATIDTLIYVVGGRNSSAGGNTNKLEAYSPATNQWRTLANMPTARGGLAAAALQSKLYVFGGETPGVFDEVEEYDPSTNAWRPMAPMPAPRHGIGAATIADTIFIIGGGPREGFGVSGVNSGFTISSLGTGVSEKQDAPGRYALYQNYPNPFNPTTSIRFEAPASSVMSLKIFDTVGREVVTLVDGKLEAGAHTVEWNAGGLPSAVYFCRLQADDFIQTRKLLLLK